MSVVEKRIESRRLLLQTVTGGTHDGAQWHYHYDGNGNVTELTNASGATVATYRYTAFGDTWSATGTAAQANHYRFSTKPIDGEVIRSASSAFSSGLYYYGYRFYDPSHGRWINRDPIGEQGGLNLYAMVGNDAVNQWDVLGEQSGSSSGMKTQTTRYGSWTINYNATFTFDCQGASASLDNVSVGGVTRFSLAIVGYNISVTSYNASSTNWNANSCCWTIQWSATTQLDVNLLDIGFFKGATWSTTSSVVESAKLCCE